jgi:UDP-N-acetylmuramoyl-tripeptide--D-alanyl-D-alanine ligase
MKNLLKKIVVQILTFEAEVLLRRKQPFIIAVTGSVGKTSAKDAIYSIIKKHHSTRKSDKSFNSDIGVPLTVLGLPNAWNNPFLWLKNILDGMFIALFSTDYPEYLILETGVDRPGDMQKLTNWIKPNIAVLTRFPDVPVHVEFFSAPEAVVVEKMYLAQALKPDGVLVYNHDDPIIQAQLNNVRHKAIGFGRYLKTHFNATEDKVVYNDDIPTGIAFNLEHFGETYQVRVMGSVGVPLVYTYVSAIAVASQCGISIEDSIIALESHLPPPGRMRIIKGIKGSVIIDDTYNSSPVAVEQAISTLGEIKHAKRKIAVLGDMLELGKFSAREHEKVGEFVGKTADVLFAIGVRARGIAEAALTHGIKESAIFQYEDVARAGKELQAYIKPGDVILIKGSQGMRAEKVVEEIMSDPEQSHNLLVRQDTAWSKR